MADLTFVSIFMLHIAGFIKEIPPPNPFET